MRCEKDVLLREINTRSFAVDDLKLFLDTHPDSEEALRALNSNLAAREEAVNKYEAVFGPLTIEGQSAKDVYAWTEGPWPWEKEG